MVIEKAFAKINLTLSVGEKRSDGYHNIDSIMHQISLHDEVILESAETISLSVTEGTAPFGEENLMWRAAELFFKETGISGGVHMELKKRIPSEAGLGGGSADAAAVLRGLNRLTGRGLTLASLAQMGALLGADVPFCVAGGCCRCRGIGEKMEKLQGRAGLDLLVVRPPVSIATGKAYALFDKFPKSSKNTAEDCILALKEDNREKLAKSLFNDFERVLFRAEPLLKETALYLESFERPFLMTGSGSAFFLLPENKDEGEKIKNTIKSEKPEWYAEEAETEEISRL